MQPITRELQAVSFLLACNIFTVQPRNFNDGNTFPPTVGLQPFATGVELLCQLDLLPHTIVQTNTTKRHVAIEAQALTLEEAP